jgi:hypothetical protein
MPLTFRKIYAKRVNTSTAQLELHRGHSDLSTNFINPLTCLYQIAVEKEVSTACLSRAGLRHCYHPLTQAVLTCMYSRPLFLLQLGITITNTTWIEEKAAGLDSGGLCSIWLRR